MTVKFPTSKVTDAFETCKKIEFYTLKWINNKCFKVNYNIIILLIILPIILDIFFIKLYGVNVPYMDQWVFVPLIDKFYNSNLDLNDLFAQHNEHRLPFARIIMLISMYFTHYNNVAEMYISCSIASLTLFMLFLLYKQQFGLSRSSLIGFIPVSWLLFDFRQYDNILLGFTIHIYLAIFGLIVSIYSLKNTRKIDRMFVLAILGGVLSSFSFLTGLLIWPLGLLLIVVSSKTDKISLGASWSFAGIVTLCIYFYNWVKPAQTPNLLYSLKNPLDSIAYMFIYIGSFYGIEIHKDIIQIHGAVTSGSLMSFIFVHISAVLGVLIVFATIISISLIIKNGLFEETSEWIALIAFSISSAIITTIGRAGFGLEQALSSRYVTLSLLGILGLYLIVLRLKGVINNGYNILYKLILCFIVLGLVFGYVSGIFVGEIISESREKMAFSVLHFDTSSDESLISIYPDAHIIRDRASILKKYKLNVFYNTSTMSLMPLPTSI